MQTRPSQPGHVLMLLGFPPNTIKFAGLTQLALLPARVLSYSIFAKWNSGSPCFIP